MSEVDIIKSLTDFGLTKEEAIDLKSRLSASDYLEMAASLGSDDFGESFFNVDKILKKYGVDMSKRKANETASRKVRYDFENLSETVEFIDLLEEHGVKYTIGSVTSLIIESESEDISEKIKSFMENKYDKKAKEAKKKLDNLSPRNPIVQAMSQRSGGGYHTNQKKVIDRKKKYKDKYFESKDIPIGSKVKVGGSSGVVEIAKGPQNTIGINIDGKIKMVKKNEVEELNETVLGITTPENLLRLKELAGVRSTVKENPITVDDELDGIDFEAGDDLVSVDEPLEPTSADNEISDVQIIPSEVQENPSEGLQSASMTSIVDSVETIRGCLSEIRLSEFQQVISMLNELLISTKNMGRNFLGEGRE